MNPVRCIDERDGNAVNAAIDEIVEKVVKPSPTLMNGIRKTYAFKKKYNPNMVDFATWLRDVWATQLFQEANRFCGGYTLAKAERIANIEYFGTPLARKEKEVFPTVEWSAYVEGGRVNLTFYVRDKQNASIIFNEMKHSGYDDVEIIGDYDKTLFPVTGTRKFI